MIARMNVYYKCPNWYGHLIFRRRQGGELYRRFSTLFRAWVTETEEEMKRYTLTEVTREEAETLEPRIVKGRLT